MRVMGVDPGLARCGVALVEGGRRDSALVAHRLVSTPPDQPTGQRLAAVHDAVGEVLGDWRPDAVAMERLLFNANTRSAMAVAQAVGVILLAAARAGHDVVDYTPTTVKATVTGHGGADKEQMKYLVRAQLRLDRAPRSADVADAAAVALCHLWSCGDRSADGIGGHSPRLAELAARAAPGAQVVQAAPGRSRVPTGPTRAGPGREPGDAT